MFLSEWVSGQPVYNPTVYALDDVCLSAEEWELYRLINTHRGTKGLPPIPLSRSLTYVAQLHCWDSYYNKPSGGPCNMHSWSDKGPWKPVCYTGDHRNMHLMHSKPKELTTYVGSGYEISYGSWGLNAVAADALESWQNSAPHYAVIVNSGIWEEAWNAMGIGMYGGFAHVWFGYDKDAAKVPVACEETSQR